MLLEREAVDAIRDYRPYCADSLQLRNRTAEREVAACVPQVLPFMLRYATFRAAT